MKLSISNLAWDPAEETEVLETLVRRGVGAIDLAPTKLWPDLEAVSPSAARAYAARCRAQGIRIVALQSLVFGRPQLDVLGNAELRSATLTYLSRVIALADDLGASYLLLGAARNRRRLGRPLGECIELAVPLFRALAEEAARRGLTFCIEPLAAQYGCDFVCDSREAAMVANHVDHPGFGVLLDTGVLSLNGERLEDAVEHIGDHLRYVHLSEPFLAPVDAIAQADNIRRLCRLGYDGWVSVEMLMDPARDNASHIAAAIAYLCGSRLAR